ncbi:MAG TPA: glycosyltransferase [Verrucomicrobiae bacterium]|nr:glycosyltransferase [Verrucomicrobiae bacterium]
MTPAIFVSNTNYLFTSGGGVQWCTRDYLETIAAAGLQAIVSAYDNDQRFLSRFRRKLRPRPFTDLINPTTVSKIVAEQKASAARWIFLNNSEPLALAAAIKIAVGQEARVIYLSHGVESTDQLNDLRLDVGSIPPNRRQPAWIGRLFLAELEQRRQLDGVVCVSEEDVLFERWLGSENLCFLPRSVRQEFLDLRPVLGRVGTVGTLSHIPNLDGIRRLAVELDRQTTVRLRLVGGPPTAGEKLAREFRSIEYVGQLDDAALKKEAATWCAFVNPIFCQARGISTKVATALGWGLPVLTTAQGSRGYRWNDAVLPRSQSPKELAELSIHVASDGDQKNWRARATQLSQLAPDLREAGRALKDFLSRLAGE